MTTPITSKAVHAVRSAVLVLLLATACLAAPAHSGKYLAYVGTYTDSGSKGIYAYQFDTQTGELTSLGLAATTPNPTFFVIAPNQRFLYAANEISNFEGSQTGAVTAFSIDRANGKLTELNEVSSRSAGPAYITLDRSGKYALVANYPHGSIAVLPILPDGKLGAATAFVQHHGSSVNPDRQTEPHAHCIILSPDNRFAIVADLGLDQLLVYPFNSANGTLGAAHIVKVHPGAGPRHLAFSSNGKFLYLITEMGNTIITYSYEPKRGLLHELQTVPTLPPDFKAFSKAAEIQISQSGRFLYASNRGKDDIVVFARNPLKGTLTRVEADSTEGKFPRHFALDPSGKWLLAEDKNSGNIVVFHVNRATGHLTPSGHGYPIASPVCLQFMSAAK